MSYAYQNADKFVRIEWDWVPEDDEYHSPYDVIRELFEMSKPRIMEDFMVHEDDWEEFIDGMSMMVDKVERFDLTFNPCKGGVLVLYKHICKICGKTCGLSSTYCDGTGKSTNKCSDCGTTDHRHGPTYVWTVR